MLICAGLVGDASYGFRDQCWLLDGDIANEHWLDPGNRLSQFRAPRLVCAITALLEASRRHGSGEGVRADNAPKVGSVVLIESPVDKMAVRCWFMSKTR